MSTTIIRMTNGQYWVVPTDASGKVIVADDTGKRYDVFHRYISYEAAYQREAMWDMEFYYGIEFPSEEELLASPAYLTDASLRVFFEGHEPTVRDLAVKRWGVTVAEAWDPDPGDPLASGLTFGDAYRFANDRKKNEVGDIGINLPVHLLVAWLERDLKARGRTSR